mgnify:CR=1 FL=1
MLLHKRGGWIRSNVTRQTYRIVRGVSCQTNNVVYVLTCDLPGCKKQYVGQSKRQMGTRLKEHLADIKHKRDTPVAIHFNLPKHKASHLTPTILEVIKRDPKEESTTLFRLERERFWIYQLRTMTPQGINVQG